ncbi:MAG: helix-turn-helix domain-containing protein [Fluviicola sp.]|jgi:predicted HTH transcriptional regulator
MESLQSIIRLGEGQQLDFKFRIDDQKKIARTLCAFANTDGGTLLIGVKDNGKVVGVDPTEELHMIEAAADMYCSPKLEFNSRVWKEGMKLVLEISIEKAAEIPVMALDEEKRWRAYVRREDHTLLANKILLNVWKLQKSQQPKPEKIGSNETALLGIISESNRITLSKLYRSSNLAKKDVDRLLSLFIYWKLVEMHLTELETVYSIKNIE